MKGMITMVRPLGQRLPKHLLGCISAFAALIAGIQFFANALQVGDPLFIHYFSDLTIRDLFANTDVHVRCAFIAGSTVSRIIDQDDNGYQLLATKWTHFAS